MECSQESSTIKKNKTIIQFFIILNFKSSKKLLLFLLSIKREKKGSTYNNSQDHGQYNNAYYNIAISVVPPRSLMHASALPFNMYIVHIQYTL